MFHALTRNKKNVKEVWIQSIEVLAMFANSCELPQCGTNKGSSYFFRDMIMALPGVTPTTSPL